MSQLYLSHYAGAFSRSHTRSRAIAEASAKNWSAQIMGAIKETKMVLLDEVRKEEVFTDDGGHFQSSEL
jgi:hypothetical protein